MPRIISIQTGPNTGPTPPPPPPPLNAPTLAGVAVSSSQINLTAAYTPPPALATYTFQQAPTAAGPWAQLLTQASPNLSVASGLAAATTFYFRVNVQTAETPPRTSAWSLVVPVTTQAVSVPVPTPTLAVSAITTTTLTLTAAYTGPPPLATYTFSYSATSAAGPWTALGTAQAGNTYAVTGLTAATPYWFEVTIQTTEVPSRTSAPGAASATTQSAGLPVPGEVINVAYSSTQTSVTVTWPVPTTGGAVATYTISFNGTVTSGLTSPTFTQPGLTAATSYPVIVTAVNATGSGPPSATLITSTKALQPSASGATLVGPTATGSLVDAALNVWTLTAGIVYQNAVATVSSNVILLLYYNGVIYQENSSALWWSWNGASWTAIGGDPRTVTPPPVTGGISISNGLFMVNGAQFNPIGVAMVSTEEAEGWAGGNGGRIKGIATVTTAQYQAAITAVYNSVSTAAKPYCLINLIRVPLNSTLWMGYTGLDAFGSSAGNYYSVGTDTNGRKIFSGGPGGGLGSGPGHETNGDPTAYRNYILGEVASILGAGLVPMLDLHEGTPILVSTGQYVLPAGQSGMPGGGDNAFWQSIAETFGSQNTTTGSPLIMFELHNESCGTNIYSNMNGPEALWLGSKSLTQFPFPTTTTSPNGLAGGWLMINDLGGTSSIAPITVESNPVCYACGFQQFINTIRATGATNVIVVGCQDFTGDTSTWSYAGGPMVVTDTLNPQQLAAAFHAYGGTGETGNFEAIQAAGLGFICTEMGSLSNNGNSYVQYRSKGWGYTWWSNGGWNNYGSSANIYLSGGMTAGGLWNNSNGDPNPTGSN